MYPYASLELHSFLLCEADAVLMGKSNHPPLFLHPYMDIPQFDKLVNIVVF